MGIISESFMAYAQPLIDAGDGTKEQLQMALSISQICWNLALQPEKELKDNLAEMQADLRMDADTFADFCESLIMPMIRRHHEMFPDLSPVAAKATSSNTQIKEYPKTGRNAPCPCGSGEKYKHCCGK